MEYIELQATIRDGSTITDVVFRNNRLYFRVDGHLFSTYGSYVYHEKHPLFAHIISDMISRTHNDPKGIAEDEIRSKQIEEEMELYHKHKAALYRIIFMRGLEILADSNGDEAEFTKYIDYHLDIMENGNHCQKLISLLEKK